MNVKETKLSGVLVLEPDVFSDERGFFLETWNSTRYEDAGIARVTRMPVSKALLCRTMPHFPKKGSCAAYIFNTPNHKVNWFRFYPARLWILLSMFAQVLRLLVIGSVK